MSFLSLTSGAVLTLALVLALGWFAVTTLAWPRWPGVAGVARRGALLAVGNVVVLLAAGITLNDQFGFYSSWTDLGQGVGLVETPLTGRTGTAGGDPKAAVEQAAARPASGVPAVGQAPVSVLPASAPLPPLPPQVHPGERFAWVSVSGPRSGIRSAVHISLPRGYSDPANRTRRYPVIETFPGYPGTPFNPSRALDQLVVQHRMGPVIVISPTAEIPVGTDTECVDGGAVGEPVETYLTEDLPDWAVHHLRVSLDRAGWATAGLSAGGWCAAMAAMLHPQQYAAAIVMGGYFRPLFGPLYEPFAPGTAAASRYDLVALAGSRPPPIAVWLQTSPGDNVSYPTSHALLGAAKSPLSVHSLVLPDAGHRLDVWLPLFPQAFAWLATVDPQFAPTATG